MVAFRMTACGLGLGLVLWIGACHDNRADKGAMSNQESSGPLYFVSPAVAVSRVSELMLKADWHTLARYYDLSGNDAGATREEMTSGRYFVKDLDPKARAAVAPSRFLRPFTPGAVLDHTDQLGEVTTVFVRYEVDQGEGMKQRTIQQFKMIHTAKGFQLLPSSIGR